MRSVSVTKGLTMGIICAGITEIWPVFKKALPTYIHTALCRYIILGGTSADASADVSEDMSSGDFKLL